MGEHNRPVYCPWCRTEHGRRFLCDAAADVLIRAAQRGESLNLPSIELDQPIQMTPDPKADTLISQLVVKAGLIPAPDGTVHPALVFSGLDAQRRVLPQWIYPADDVNLRRAAPLIHDMTEMAISRADQQNRNRS